MELRRAGTRSCQIVSHGVAIGPFCLVSFHLLPIPLYLQRGEVRPSLAYKMGKIEEKREACDQGAELGLVESKVY